jgi:hypothetical protein
MEKPEPDFILHMTQEDWERIAALAGKPEKGLAVLMSEFADIKARLHLVTTLLRISLERSGLPKAEVDLVIQTSLLEARKTYGQRAASRLVTLGGLSSR